MHANVGVDREIKRDDVVELQVECVESGGVSGVCESGREVGDSCHASQQSAPPTTSNTSPTPVCN